MLKLSRKTLLALEAVIDIAFTPRADPVQAKEITARQGVPQRYLEQVMQQLVRVGILKGVRGPHGGYRLARERRRIFVGDIVRAAENAEETAEDAAALQSEIGRAVVLPFVEALQKDVMTKLDAISIDDFCTKARAAGLGRNAEPANLDFVI